MILTYWSNGVQVPILVLQADTPDGLHGLFEKLVMLGDQFLEEVDDNFEWEIELEVPGGVPRITPEWTDHEIRDALDFGLRKIRHIRKLT